MAPGENKETSKKSRRKRNKAKRVSNSSLGWNFTGIKFPPRGIADILLEEEMALKKEIADELDKLDEFSDTLHKMRHEEKEREKHPTGSSSIMDNIITFVSLVVFVSAIYYIVSVLIGFWL